MDCFKSARPPSFSALTRARLATSSRIGWPTASCPPPAGCPPGGVHGITRVSAALNFALDGSPSARASVPSSPLNTGTPERMIAVKRGSAGTASLTPEGRQAVERLRPSHRIARLCASRLHSRRELGCCDKGRAVEQRADREPSAVDQFPFERTPQLGVVVDDPAHLIVGESLVGRQLRAELREASSAHLHVVPRRGPRHRGAFTSPPLAVFAKHAPVGLRDSSHALVEASGRSPSLRP